MAEYKMTDDKNYSKTLYPVGSLEHIISSLNKLREPFPENQIGKLAKGSKAQTQCQPSEKKKCDICGGFHHPKMIHLDYVGHAALTDRLLDIDPFWTWEPLAYKEGLPAFDTNGGLWIKLTVCGHTRLGYGNASSSEYKEIGSREKEVIGDALRNAAMRFGAALELWHKGQLHDDEPEQKKEPEKQPDEKPHPTTSTIKFSTATQKSFDFMCKDKGANGDDIAAILKMAVEMGYDDKLLCGNFYNLWSKYIDGKV